MRRWLGAEAVVEAHVGGTLRLHWDTGDQMRGLITIFEPERLIEYTWDEGTPGEESVVRFELRPDRSGTLLILQHSRVPAGQAPALGAGWHAHLDALAATLAGESLDPHERYGELRPAYVGRFGEGEPR
jgi:uncharacterized protein YndB with AHSA1/START domain